MPSSLKPPVERPYTTEVFYSYVTEFFSALQLLADSRHHAFGASFAETIYQRLPKEMLGTLTKIATFPYQGLEFAEFYMKGSVAHDLVDCLSYMEQLSDEHYLTILFDGIIPAEAVIALYKRTITSQQLIERHPDLSPINMNLLHSTFYETKAFRKEMNELFCFLDHDPFFKENLDKALLECKPAIDALKIAFLGTDPQTLVHKLIRKKWPLPETEHYWFIPSYFISPHHTLMIKDKTLAVLYDARLSTDALTRASAKIAGDLSALTDKTRIEILRILISKPTYNRILAAMLNLSTATISHHLDILKKAGLIDEKPYKKMRIFSANHDAITRLIQSLPDYLYNK